MKYVERIVCTQKYFTTLRFTANLMGKKKVIRYVFRAIEHLENGLF